MKIPKRVINLTDQKFGRLVVKEFAGIVKHAARWLCECSCGGTIVVASQSLRRGLTKSDGCWNKEYKRKPNSGNFKKGHVGYRHPKGTRTSPETEFKSGNVPHNFDGYYKPRVYMGHATKRPEIMTTVPEKHIVKSRGKEYLTSKITTYARVVYCNHNDITLKELGSKIVWHIDMDQDNNDPRNLEAITRAELLKRNQNRSIRKHPFKY